MNIEVTPDNAARATPVAWRDPKADDVITDSRKQEWEKHYGAGGLKKASYFTEPLYSAATVTALEAEVASLRALLVSVTNPDGSPNLDAAQLGAAESYRVAAINANSRADAAERRVAELVEAIGEYRLSASCTNRDAIARLDALTGAGAK